MTLSDRMLRAVSDVVESRAGEVDPEDSDAVLWPAIREGLIELKERRGTGSSQEADS